MLLVTVPLRLCIQTPGLRRATLPATVLCTITAIAAAEAIAPPASPDSFPWKRQFATVPRPVKR
jgi:hypothetical protein